MEEDAVLVVGEGVVDLLVPDDAATRGRDVDQFQPEGVADQVVGQHDGALQPRVRPSVTVGVGDVEFGDGDGVDLVGRLGHCTLHRLLVLVRQNRRHSGSLCALGLGMARFGGHCSVRVQQRQSCPASWLSSSAAGGCLVLGD